MAIELSEVKTIAQSQRYIFENVVIQRINNDLVANLQFKIINEKDERIGTQNYEYRNEKFNEFWSSFNSGKFLYDELVKKSMLPIAVDDSVENDFVYVKPPEPVKPAEPIVVNSEPEGTPSYSEEGVPGSETLEYKRSLEATQ